MNKQKEKEFLIENYPRTINDFMERELFLYDNTKKSRERTIRDVKLEFIENISYNYLFHFFYYMDFFL